MRLANRRDANHAEIVSAFEQCGWRVLDLSRVGQGCPDILIAKAGKTALVEIKIPKGKLRQNQSVFASLWAGKVYTCRTMTDVLKVHRENMNAEAP